MQQVLDFLRKAGVFYLATADGDQPHVRPMGFAMDCGGKLTLCTGNKKPMCRQLAANPKVEICAYDGKGNTLRICGKAVFATSEETQRKALEFMPSLQNIYSVGDGVFEIFYIDEVKAVYSGMDGASQELPV